LPSNLSAIIKLLTNLPACLVVVQVHQRAAICIFYSLPGICELLTEGSAVQSIVRAACPREAVHFSNFRYVTPTTTQLSSATPLSDSKANSCCRYSMNICCLSRPCKSSNNISTNIRYATSLLLCFIFYTSYYETVIKHGALYEHCELN